MTKLKSTFFFFSPDVQFNRRFHTEESKTQVEESAIITKIKFWEIEVKSFCCKY